MSENAKRWGNKFWFVSIRRKYGKCLCSKAGTCRITRHSQHVRLYTRGVNTALATFYKVLSIHNSHNNNTRIDMVLLDVQSAFNNVWHARLNHKIFNLNLHPCLTKILSNCITDRSACVRLDTYADEELHCIE